MLEVYEVFVVAKYAELYVKLTECAQRESNDDCEKLHLD